MSLSCTLDLFCVYYRLFFCLSISFHISDEILFGEGGEITEKMVIIYLYCFRRGLHGRYAGASCGARSLFDKLPERQEGLGEIYHMLDSFQVSLSILVYLPSFSLSLQVKFSISLNYTIQDYELT